MNTTTNRTNRRDTQGKAPDLIAWHIPERENAPWSRIGAAWAHGDGAGYSLQLDLMPIVPGRIALRVNTKDG